MQSRTGRQVDSRQLVCGHRIPQLAAVGCSL